jgi:hypothetical protein
VNEGQIKRSCPGAICVQAAFKKQILLRYAGIGGAYGCQECRYPPRAAAGSRILRKAHALVDGE